ncbi:MAG: ComF family protein [Ilyomonas sp.]
MIKALQSYLSDFAHLFFPHNCVGCGSDVVEQDQMLCGTCFFQLPETNFFNYPNNSVEKVFAGRIKLEAAGSAYYFTKHSILQNLVFELKYRGNKEVGLLLGELTARQMSDSKRFEEIDIIIPLPLNKQKEKKRGYNQAAMIAGGMTKILHKPVMIDAVARNVFTETQTHKDRVSRWKTMQDVFEVSKPEVLKGKHVLLIDDVVTTGATLEACGQTILNTPETRLSSATVAYTI